MFNGDWIIASIAEPDIDQYENVEIDTVTRALRDIIAYKHKKIERNS